jgi:hypothetical protein
VDNLPYHERERTANAEAIVSVLEQNGISYQWLSDVLGKGKYPVLVSTGLSYFEVRTPRSLFKYIYALTIGTTLEFTGVADLLERFTGRRFAGGGLKAVSYEMRQPENSLGRYTVRYPKGLDVSRKFYPEKRWRGVFDLHFCHGAIDSELIKEKFPGESTVIIGYPKYSSRIDRETCRQFVYKEFGMQYDKPLILWMPTHLKKPEETGQNVLPWIIRLSHLLNDYNIVVRIHPKTATTTPRISELLNSHGFSIDLKKDRNLQELYMAADIVLADFGASVLSAVYMKKNLLLLGFDPLPASIRRIQDAGYLDIDMRKLLPVVHDEYQVSNLCTDAINSAEPNSLAAREQIFGKTGNAMSVPETAALLRERGEIEVSSGRVA